VDPPAQCPRLILLHYQGNVTGMAIAHSKLTAQGQISVPAEVRKKLGVGPGSVLEWEERNDEVVVRRAGRYSSADIHSALFESGVTSKNTQELKEGIRRHMRKKHARR
jgi:antitoxin PrlF